MDKEWMSKSRLSMEYENGVEYFLNFAIQNGKDPEAMSCPCVKCGNLRDADVKTIRAHLTYNGIDLTYRILPCNVGWHWILLVVDPHKQTVYVLDSLSHEDHVEEWKTIIKSAMKMFNMSIGKRGRQNLLWEVIKCQQQPDSKQCGFYVMRYMKDIIENSQSISMSILFSEGFYLKGEIDEVRKEWAEFVDDFTS